MSNIIPTLRYLWLTIRHKYFVFKVGLQIECPLWRLMIHDWTKFLPCELPHYGRQFFGSEDDSYNFNKAWLHHQNLNDHHWEWWISRTMHNKSQRTDTGMLYMSEEAIKEMVADWLGASRAYEGKWPESFESWEWYQKNFNNLPILQGIKIEIDYILRYYWFKHREI